MPPRPSSRGAKLKTRGRKVVCRCVSHGCSKYTFINVDGKRERGVELAIDTRKRHAISDLLIQQPQTTDTRKPRKPSQCYSTDSSSSSSESEDSSSSEEESSSKRTCSPELEPPNLSLAELELPSLSQAESKSPLDQNELITTPARSCLESGLSHLNKHASPMYDCSSFYCHHLTGSNPVILHICLFAAICHVLEHCSVATSSFILKSQMDLIKIALSGGLLPEPLRNLSAPEATVMKTIPSDIHTVIRWLQLAPLINRFVCCPQCFAIYPDKLKAPENCTHVYIRDQTQLREQNRLRDKTKPTDASGSDLRVCGTPLFKTTNRGRRIPASSNAAPSHDLSIDPPLPDRIPIRYYATQDLFHWIARLFSRPTIEDTLDSTAKASQKPYDPTHVADIQESRVWKEFIGPDGKQFTSQSSNLVFGMFTDGINPYGSRQSGKHVSVTFIVLVCLSLPVELRRLPENVFLVGIAPGPKEPTVELFNWILIPIVEQLRTLWRTGIHLSQTYRHPHGRHIFAALLPFFADLPALRRALGFASANANRMCSYCSLPRPDISNLDPTTWPKRTLDEHKLAATKYHHSKTGKAREKLLSDDGARYSALLKLEYWNIIEYHVVDSMHNLLLGLLQWHCRKFWCMSDKHVSQNAQHSNADDLSSTNRSHDPTNITIFNAPFTSETDPNDLPFDPTAADDGWDGHWTAASEVILDSRALSFINNMLPRVRIPTWIKRAVPVLGKASFGRLKADEWRNLFTVQLPLILPLYWSNSLATTRSLLHNFSHLVSLVNIAMKRSTSTDQIHRYRHHIKSYLASCLVIFEDVQLAPNHHMAMHLADCMERFGPTRSYWSFPMERAMGQVLKACNNNRFGDMEITFLNKFCEAGNLKSLLEAHHLPASMEPFVGQLRSYFDPIPFMATTNDRTHEDALDDHLFKDLIQKINEKFPIKNKAWVSSNDYSALKGNRSNFVPITSRATFLKSHTMIEEIYSPFHVDENNSTVSFKNGSKTSHGRIESIFKHSRTGPDNEVSRDVFFAIKPLAPINPVACDPFIQLSDYEMQVALLRFHPKVVTRIFHESEILFHCAWIEFKAGEISKEIQFETIAAVVLDRS